MSDPGLETAAATTAGRRGAASWNAALLLMRVTLAAIFLYAASTKFTDMFTFAEEVANYQVLPPAGVAPIAAVVLGIEVLASLMLLAGARVRAAAATIVVLLLIFIAALTQALQREIDLRCGCFGGVEPATWATVWRDSAMLLPAIVLMIKGGGRYGLDRP